MTATCTTPGCMRPPYRRGLCNACRKRLSKRGTTDYLDRKTPQAVRLTLAFRAGPANECWPWLLKPDTTGYGRFRRDDGILTTAHRAVYELFRGPIPPNKVLDHLCRNRICVNPGHLEPTSISENVDRGHFDRSICPHGHDRTARNGITIVTRSDGTTRHECTRCRTARQERRNARRREARQAARRA